MLGAEPSLANYLLNKWRASYMAGIICLPQTKEIKTFSLLHNKNDHGHQMAAGFLVVMLSSSCHWNCANVQTEAVWVKVLIFDSSPHWKTHLLVPAFSTGFVFLYLVTTEQTQKPSVKWGTTSWAFPNREIWENLILNYQASETFWLLSPMRLRHGIYALHCLFWMNAFWFWRLWR